MCQGLVAEVERVARANGALGVERIEVRVGALAGVEPELLAGAFEIARAGTIARSATLHITTVGARIACGACGAQAEVAPNRLLCPACGAWQIQLLAGDEMLLERVVLLSEASDAIDAGADAARAAPDALGAPAIGEEQA